MNKDTWNQTVNADDGERCRYDMHVWLSKKSDKHPVCVKCGLVCKDKRTQWTAVVEGTHHG